MNKCREKLNKCVFYFSNSLIHLYKCIFVNNKKEIKEEVKKNKEKCYYCEINYVPVKNKSIIHNNLNFCSILCMLEHLSRPYI
jgi:hypothetical protein